MNLLIPNIFCLDDILFCRKKIFLNYSLHFYKYMLKYTCKSVVDTEIHQTAHHFPPYQIGKSLERNVRGFYHFFKA